MFGSVVAVKLGKPKQKYTWQKLNEEVDSNDGQDAFRVLQIVLGSLLILSSISLVYKITKRLARAYTLTSAKVVKNVDVNNPSSENNFKLVHCSGKLNTNSEI